MSIFDTHAIAAVQSIAATYADDAVYTPAGGGSPVDVRVVLGWVDDRITFPGLDTEARSPGIRAEVAQADIPDVPQPGAIVQVLTGVHAGDTFTVKDAFADVERSQWTLDLS